jgi:hypothetical protein
MDSGRPRQATTTAPPTYRIGELVGVMFCISANDNALFGELGQVGIEQGQKN